MSRTSPLWLVAVMLVCLGSVGAGCSRTPSPAPVAAHDSHDDHDHDHGDHDHDHPTSLADGIAAVAKAAAAVKDHLARDAADEADDAVHELGHLLEDLQGFVRKADLPAAAKAAATRAIDDLFECFDTLDTALHATPGKGQPPQEVHASVADRIEAAIGSLRKAVSVPAAVEDEAAAIIRNARQAKEE